MKNATRIVPIDRLRRMAEDGGSHWFERGTMRFFRSRVSREAYLGADGRWYFVTSEQGPNGIRAYSVRAATYEQTPEGPTFDVDSVAPGFQAYETRAQAYGGLRRALHDAAVGAAPLPNTL